MMMMKISLIMKTHCSTMCKLAKRDLNIDMHSLCPRLQKITFIVEGGGTFGKLEDGISKLINGM
jgi:hypothetical protein